MGRSGGDKQESEFSTHAMTRGGVREREMREKKAHRRRRKGSLPGRIVDPPRREGMLLAVAEIQNHLED